MKRTCLILSLALIVAILFVGCDDSTTVDSRSSGQGYNGRVVGTVHGVVTTHDTNSPLENVRVAYVTEGSTHEVRTDANGIYRLDGLREGTYRISFLSPDTSYADWSVAVDVYYDSANAHPSDVDYHVVLERMVTLYRRSAGINGYVFAQLDNETTYPAAGATVRAMYSNGVLNADYTTTTDENGAYTFHGLPACPMTVVVLPWMNNGIGFGTAATPLTLPDAGGMVIAPSLVLARAVAGVVVLSNNFANGNFPVNDNLSLVFNKAVEDSSLQITFTRGGTSIPQVHSLDESGMSLTIDPAVELMTNASYTLFITGRTADYANFSFGPMSFSTERGIEIENTNVWPPDGMPERNDVGLSDTLMFTFTKPVDTTNPQNMISLYHASNPSLHILTDDVFSADLKTLWIIPVGQLMPLNQYGVGLTLHSTMTNDMVMFSHTFTTVDIADMPGAVTGLVSDTTNHVDWNTSNIRLNWNCMAGITYYEVFAYDDFGVTEHVRVASPPSTGVLGHESVVVTLPSSFDWLREDALITPFSSNIHVTFVVRAVNARGEGPFSGEVTVSDVMPPHALGISQDVSANNAAGADPITVICHFSSPIEYCDASTMPDWGFIEHGGSGTYVLPADAASWDWTPDARNGTLTITVPAHRNGAGDYVWISRLIDNSGNVSHDSVRTVLN
jgi:hypothetical protein